MTKQLREPIATWYEVSFNLKHYIAAVPVVAYTDKSFTKICGMRLNHEQTLRRVSENYEVFQTFEDAKAGLIERCCNRVADLEEYLADARRDLERAENLTVKEV